MKVRTQRVPMPMLPTEVAVTTFDEGALGHSREQAMQEAARAEGADLSAAHAACPLGVDITRFVRQIADGDFDGALGTVVEAHPWPKILGRWCQAYCEYAHSLGPD